MSPIRQRRRSYPKPGEKKIPAWVPLAIIFGFFVLVGVMTHWLHRGWVIVNIVQAGESVDENGIYIQQDYNTCVPCSLATLLTEEGYDVTVAELAWAAGTDMYGTNPEGVIDVGKEYGYQVRHTEMDFDELMAADKPAIVFFDWEGSLHAVYVDPEPDMGYLIVKNPALGLTYVYKNGVGEYFRSHRWEVFLFEEPWD